MTGKVYGHIMSTCTQRVIFTLEELGNSYELVPIDMSKGEHFAPNYVDSKHPFARIPAYKDANGTIYESRAICRYLAAAQPGPLNVPISGAALGLFEQAASVDYSYFDPNVSSLAYEKIFKELIGHGSTDPALVKKHETSLRQCLSVYEAILAKSPYLAGEEFSLVDIFHAPWINFLPKLGLAQEIESRPNVKAWWDRVSSRPAWKTVEQKLAH